MSNVIEKVCEEKHTSVDYKLEQLSSDLNDNNNRLRCVEDAVIMLTNMVDNGTGRNTLNRTLILIILIMAVVLCGVVMGPEFTKLLIGGG